MGKQRREKRKPHKQNPIGLPSVEDDETGVDELLKDDETGLQTMLEQLQSPNVEEKLSGLQTLETMCTNELLATQAASSGVGRIVGPLLVDDNNLVRAASASALRNIASNGSDDTCSNLLEHDIMTPLTALLQRHYTTWQPKGKEKGKMDDEQETFIQAITLLWTLCENNEFAIKYSNDGHLISILIKCLDVSSYSFKISIVAAQCMLTLTEDNPLAINELRKYQSALMTLLCLKSDKDIDAANIIHLRTLAAGLLMNILNPEENTVIIACKVVSTLAETLAIDHRKLLNDLSSSIPLDKNSLTTDLEKKLNDVKKYLNAQQQALEILANLCSGDEQDDADSEVVDSDPSDDEEFPSVDDLCDKFYTMSMPVELTEIVTNHGIAQKVWDKTMLPAENVRQILSENPECKSVLEQIVVLRCRAFLCLNNLISSFGIDCLGGVDNLYRIWVDIGKVVFKEANPNDINLLESATSAMRAALQKLAEAKANMFSQLSMFDIQVMLNGEQQCPNPNVRVNLVRIVGNLALIFTTADSANSQELVKHLSMFLLDACTKESEVWVIAETLDAIMDIFAEDETNQLAAEIALVDKLQPMVNVLKNKIRQQKKKLGEIGHFFVVSTVRTNLNRFIKYKSSQIAKIK